MTGRPAHGGFPGEVVVRLPPANANGLIPLGFAWVTEESLRSLPEETLAFTCGATRAEVREARGWDAFRRTFVRSRTQG